MKIISHQFIQSVPRYRRVHSSVTQQEPGAMEQVVLSA